MAETDGRFAWERVIQTIAIAGMSSMVVWAGAQVVASDKSIAVMQGELRRVSEDVAGLRIDLKEVRDRIERVQDQVRRASQTQDRREWTPPPAPAYPAYAPTQAPGSPGDAPAFRPQTGGR